MFISTKYNIGQTFYMTCGNDCVKKVTIDAITVEAGRDPLYRLSNSDNQWFQEQGLERRLFFTSYDAFQALEQEEPTSTMA